MRRVSLIGSITLLICMITACGGGDGGSGTGGATSSAPGGSSATSTSINGVLSKGLVSAATVTAYCGGQSSGTAFGAPATTDSNGKFSLNSSSSCSQPIELIATTSANSMELDEATAESVPADFTLKAYIASPGSANTQNVTPLTDLVATAIDAQSGAPPTAAAVQSTTNAFVTNVLGGDAATYSATPMPPDQALQSQNQGVERLASLLTAISAQANALMRFAPVGAGNTRPDLTQATKQALQDLESDLTGSGSGGASGGAPNWAAVSSALEGALALYWSGQYAIDAAAVQLKRLDSAAPQFTPPAAGPSTYALGGTVSGLTGTGLVLQSNLGESLTVGANGSFTFTNQMSSGTMYAVRVATQPSGQTCTVAAGSGPIDNAAVSNVAVTCVPAYSIGGSVSGLDAGASVALANLDGDSITVSANGNFAFPTSLASGSPYAVSVTSQPSGEQCAITKPSGTVGQVNVTGILVSCAAAYQVAVAVSGLETGGSLTLELTANGETQETSATQDGTVTFPVGLVSGTSFQVSVSAFPTGQGCLFSGYNIANGTVAGPSFVVPLQCMSGYMTIGGTVSGLAPGSTLVLQDSTEQARAGTETLSITANGPYMFAAPVAGNTLTTQPVQGAYSVSFAQQPLNQNCTWAYGDLSPPAGSYPYQNVAQLNIVCSAAYTLAGSVVTSSGTPVTTGFVTITGTAPFPGSSSDSKTAYFDGEGDFSLPAPPGTYTVVPYTSNGLTLFSPASVTVVVGNSAPSAISFTCVSGCPTSTSSGGGGTIGTGGGSSGGSGGGGTGTATCNFSSCVTPLSASCINTFPDPNYYNWFSFTNNCGQPIHLTFSVRGTGIMGAGDYAPGQTENTGDSATDAPNGFLLAVCPYGYVPWNATSNQYWDGSSEFYCVTGQ